jgi:hypothetical protein
MGIPDAGLGFDYFRRSKGLHIPGGGQTRIHAGLLLFEILLEAQKWAFEEKE